MPNLNIAVIKSRPGVGGVDSAARCGDYFACGIYLDPAGAEGAGQDAPERDHLDGAYDTPADLIRFLLGLAVCLWLGVQLFQGPSDASGYRTWIYLGLVAVPFALICLFAVW
jgi:hypothetical protein